MPKKFNAGLLIGALLLIPFLNNAQVKSSSSTSSPYSRYGVGTLSNYSFGRSEAMGGIGIGLRYNYQVNAGNPASYTAIDSLSFLMQFGANSRQTVYKTDEGKTGANNINFDYLAFSFPIKGWWATAFGIQPVSEKGYSISLNASTNNIFTSANFNGTGALSKVFWGNGFDLTKNFSVGLNTWYMFGNLIDQAYIYFPDDANAYDYLSSKNLVLHNFGISTGLQYHFVTKNKNQWTIGAVLEPKQNLSMRYTLFEDRALFRGTNSQVVDTLTNVTSDAAKLSLPLSYGAGFTVAIKNKMIIGADYYHQQWDKTIIPETTDQFLTNRSRYSAGMEWTPNENSITSYWKRSHFRAGLFYENSYLRINNEQIKGYGLTFGVGMPFPRSRSTLNLSAEIGRLGSKSNNLLLEEYIRFTAHILLYDRWFMKRKFE